MLRYKEEVRWKDRISSGGKEVQCSEPQCDTEEIQILYFGLVRRKEKGNINENIGKNGGGGCRSLEELFEKWYGKFGICSEFVTRQRKLRKAHAHPIPAQ